MSHAIGKKHVKNHESVSCFFKPRVDKNVSDCPTATTSQKKDSNALANQKQSTLELIVNYDDKTKAEIAWTLKCVTSSYSNNSCNNLNTLIIIIIIIINTLFKVDITTKLVKNKIAHYKLLVKANKSQLPYIKYIKNVKNVKAINKY